MVGIWWFFVGFERFLWVFRNFVVFDGFSCLIEFYLLEKYGFFGVQNYD